MAERRPARGHLGLAGDLRPELLRMDGFLGNERFESCREPGKMLALSFRRDEARSPAGAPTPATASPRRAAAATSSATTACASARPSRTRQTVRHAPSASSRSSRVPRLVTGPRAGRASTDRETFESIDNPGKLAVVLSWRDMAAAGPSLARPDLACPGRQHRLMRVVRDDGLTRREEAPRRTATA